MNSTFADQIAEHVRCAQALVRQAPTLAAVIDRLIQCFDAGGRVYLLGNGGSAADAQHIAAELVGRFKQDRRPLPAVALTTDTSILTAIANDLGAETCFSRQVEALVRAGDVVWALSVSGKSPNVIRALRSAKALGACVIGFTGRGGGDFPSICDVCLRAEHDASDRVQETHQLAYHLICEAVERRYAS